MKAIIVILLISVVVQADSGTKAKATYERWERNGFEFFRLLSPELKCAGLFGATRIVCKWEFSEETFDVEVERPAH